MSYFEIEIDKIELIILVYKETFRDRFAQVVNVKF